MIEKRSYSRTGLNALKAKVKVRGLHAIDHRTAGAQFLIRRRKQLLAKYGTEQQDMIDQYVRTLLYRDALDNYLLGQQSLVSHKHRSVLPVLRERMELADSLARYLQQLESSVKPKDEDPMKAIQEKMRESE
jgi:hypothetical protein